MTLRKESFVKLAWTTAQRILSERNCKSPRGLWHHLGGLERNMFLNTPRSWKELSEREKEYFEVEVWNHLNTQRKED
jgi:hypothetical protein